MCRACPKGKFANERGSESCKICNSGRYADKEQSFECKPCAESTYLADAGINASNHDNSNDCLQCALGKFSAAGAAACDGSCPVGKWQEGTIEKGNVNCTACNVGYYQAMTGKASCKLCPEGFSQHEKSSGFCLPCVPGSFSSSRIACFARSTKVRLAQPTCGPGSFSS